MAIEQTPAEIRSLLEGADWSDLKRLPATRDTNFWFYSISAIAGPRFMFNVTKPLLDDAKSGSGRISTIKHMMNPLDGYVSAIQSFDDEDDLSAKIALGEPMALAMTAYAIEQKSWASLVDDKTQDDKHILVLDWRTHAGSRCCQAGFITPPGLIPKKESLIDLSMVLYEKNYGIDPKAIFRA